MTRRVAVLLGVVAALGCSGCGSTRHVVTQSRTTVISAPEVRLALPPAANLVIVSPHRGTGDEQFGTFTASGTVYFEFSCKGKGPLTLVGILSHISPCDGSPTGAAVPYRRGSRVHLAVKAQPGTTWRLAAGEHVPGTALLLVRSSGVGNKSFGTFHLGRTLSIDWTCKGKGNLDVQFEPTSGKLIPGIGTVCPETPAGQSGLTLPASRTARIDIDADPNVRWTISLSTTNGNAATSEQR
jgi:hypothetical protein